MKIITIVGARPQFIKAAVVSRELRKFHTEIIVHTGQHYDYNMSDIFFEELDIPRPDYNLGINGSSHGKMTGEMLANIEAVLESEQPQIVLVYGDTNSTMAGALAAVKLHIPVCHVEAGGRLGTLHNPEEVNRIITDHISEILLCCTESGMNFLKKEGLVDKAMLVGDPMLDAFLLYSSKCKGRSIKTLRNVDNQILTMPQKYYYLTCHRPENTDVPNHFLEILSAANELDAPCIYPVHPRNRKDALAIKEKHRFDNLILCDPVGYLESIYLLTHSHKAITDSGGLQREAFFAQKQCVTIFDKVVWPETMVGNRNQLARPDKKDILEKLCAVQFISSNNNPFGDGKSAQKIVARINEYANRVI